jgi:uncharacterized membrane protein
MNGGCVSVGDEVQLLLTLLAALGAGLVGGVFFAFSAFIMRALGRLPTAAGMAAMQSINVAVLNPWFLVPFVGTAVVAAGLGVWAVVDWSAVGSPWRLAGGVLYVVGTFGVTVACNVPLNDALATVAADDEGVAAVWEDYLVPWTRWNSLRTGTAVLAAGCFCLGL